MAQFYALGRVVVAGTLLTTLALAGSTDAAHNAETKAVNIETYAIGILGSAAWLMSVRLKKRLNPPS